MMKSAALKPRRSTRKSTDEQIMPLINIVFLLLSFFMIAGQLSNRSPFPLVPPQSLSNLADRPMDSTLFISGTGELSLDGNFITSDEVAEFRNHFPTDTPLRVSADAQTQASVILPVLAELRKAGWTDIILVTRRVL